MNGQMEALGLLLVFFTVSGSSYVLNLAGPSLAAAGLDGGERRVTTTTEENDMVESAETDRAATEMNALKASGRKETLAEERRREDGLTLQETPEKQTVEQQLEITKTINVGGILDGEERERSSEDGRVPVTPPSDVASRERLKVEKCSAAETNGAVKTITSHITGTREGAKHDGTGDLRAKARQDMMEEERERKLVAGIHLHEARGDVYEAARENEEETEVRSLTPPPSAPSDVPAAVQPSTQSQSPPSPPSPPHQKVLPSLPVASSEAPPDTKEEEAKSDGAEEGELISTPKPHQAKFIAADLMTNPTQKSDENTHGAKCALKPETAGPTAARLKESGTVLPVKASPPRPQAAKPSARPQLTAARTPSTRPTKTSRRGRNDTIKKPKGKKRRKDNKTQKPRGGRRKVPPPTHFPYFQDDYCPPECVCYGRVVQCSDKDIDRVPYGIPYNSRYVLLMNNHISSIQLDLLRGYVSMEFLVLSNNRLTDGATEGAFEGVPALKRLYLDRNLLESVPVDLPVSLEELRLDSNRLRVMSEAAWERCPGLSVLSLGNNSLGNGSESLPDGALGALSSLRTLNLDHNRLSTAPLGLPPSIRELYLRGNLIEQFRGGVFNGTPEMVVLDLSANRLTNKGLRRDSLLNATRLESLNLEGNRLKQVPQHLPASLKALNLEGNLISSIKKSAFSNLKNMEHLGLARNKIFRVAPGAFRTLPVLHQLDLGHNVLRQVPRLLPQGLHSIALAHNKIRSVPRDAFCWGDGGLRPSGLRRVQLEHNMIDARNLDAQAFRCLRGFQVVHFH